jgi:hypothetical protein
MPAVGDRVWIIAGTFQGCIGTVMQAPWAIDEEEFLVQLDGAPSHEECRVSMKRDLFHRLPKPHVPEWAPPLPIDDALKLDENVVELCNRWTTVPRRIPSFLQIFIHNIWILRIPLSAAEIWEIIRRHGGLPEHAEAFQHRLREGRELLSLVAPRKPVKKKRIKPLSRF